LRAYRLRPAELLVFDIVALASVQRNFRDLRQLDAVTADLCPTNEGNGAISRRRVADITGLSRSTVARILDRLIDRGMVHERRRGHLQVPVGVVLQGQHSFDLAEMFTPVALLTDQLVRLGVVRQVSGAHGDTTASQSDEIDVARLCD
jgi:DNA-binding IclR family transcriptional regulator